MKPQKMYYLGCGFIFFGFISQGDFQMAGIATGALICLNALAKYLFADDTNGT